MIPTQPQPSIAQVVAIAAFIVSPLLCGVFVWLWFGIWTGMGAFIIAVIFDMFFMAVCSGWIEDCGFDSQLMAIFVGGLASFVSVIFLVWFFVFEGHRV